MQDFDLVAANSGGSIVLGALMEDLPLGEILSLFQDESIRKSIFSPSDSLGDRVLHDLTGLGPKYSTENKLPALQHVLSSKGNIPLNKVTKDLQRPGSSAELALLIIGFDYDRNRAAFFRSSPSGGQNWGTGDTSDVTLAEAIHASTNAPVNYFDAPATFYDHSGRYWDGAISGCNNPVLAGVTEAIAKKTNPTDIVALSIGTASVALAWPQPGEAPSPFLQPIVKPGIVTDLRKLATSILDDPPDIATFLAHVMTGSGFGLNLPPADSRIVRMNPLISPMGTSGNWSAPPPMTREQFAYLANLDMDAVEQPEVDAITRYADLWLKDATRNQPIRMNGQTLTPELGQPTFTAAKAAWEAIKQ